MEKVVNIFVDVFAQATPKWTMLSTFKEVIVCGDLIFEDFLHEKLGPGRHFELPQVFPPVLDSLWSMSLG